MKPMMLIPVLLFVFTVVPAQEVKETVASPTTNTPRTVSVGSNKTTVPMEIVGGRPVVQVKINGQGPYKFILDTGAGGTLLYKKLVDELKLPAAGSTKIGDPSSPQAVSVDRVLVGTLEIGETKFSDFLAVSLANPLAAGEEIRGVLGMPLFRKLLFTIDYIHGNFVVSTGQLPKTPSSDTFDLEAAGRLGIPIKVAGTDLIATIDTGSPAYFSFPSRFMETLPLTDKPTEIGRARTLSGEAIIYGSKMNGNVVLGKFTFENPNVTFFERLNRMNIGYAFLKQFAITIDLQNGRIKFDKM